MARRRKNAVSSDIQLPQIPTKLNQILPELDALVDGSTWSECLIAGWNATATKADDVFFESCRLQRVVLAETVLPSLQMIDVHLDTCDLSAAHWEKAHLRRVELSGCRAMGARLLNGEWEDVVVQGCNLDFAMFWSTTFRATRFERCTLREASFEGANLQGVVFRECDLTGADFRDTRLCGADLRGSHLAGMRIGQNELRGAIITPAQAPHDAALLQITVKELE